MADTKKFKGAFGIVSSVAAASSAANGLRTARQDNDKLALVNALGSILVAVTGLLIAARAFRGGK
ncbi:hypothetical protein [Actinokineospora iranica]|uniref:Uncharacterized protein n=1 Tax=Actinokineospora iranica TaxID=1271860 RepID=A0A1G6N3T7_9PSEU|nr:hypothetical protein [Actinokineospora iranica]SDC62509.1 hypothetical protein SAMN05216174_103180 [Actinokineospora iranica]